MNNIIHTFLESGTLPVSTLLKSHSLTTAIDQCEQHIRSEPMDVSLRWLLIQLLCIASEWERAQVQLQAYHVLSPDHADNIRQLGNLIRAEQLRSSIFQGNHIPKWLGHMPEWSAPLFHALKHAADGNMRLADQYRAEAINAFPDTRGESNFGVFNWITDTDTRLGPTLECIVADQLLLCAMDQIQSLSITAPVSLLDLIWLPATIIIKGSEPVSVHLLTRYFSASPEDDALAFAHCTRWEQEGDYSVTGMGQKTLMTDTGDISLLDLREIRFASDEE